MWREVVAEHRFVRTEEVTTALRQFRRQFREPVTADRARLMATRGQPRTQEQRRQRSVGHRYPCLPAARGESVLACFSAREWNR